MVFACCFSFLPCVTGRRGQYSNNSQSMGVSKPAVDLRTGSMPSGIDGVRRVPEDADGDCLYHALARQVLGDPKRDQQVRSEVCDWMQHNLCSGCSCVSYQHRSSLQRARPDLFTDGSEDCSSLLAHIRQMRRRGEWGTGIEALVAAYCYKRPVFIWGPDGFEEIRPDVVEVDEPIRLLHRHGNHWETGVPEALKPAGAVRRRNDVDEKDDPDADLALALWLTTNTGSAGTGEHAAKRAAAANAAERRIHGTASRSMGKSSNIRRSSQSSQLAVAANKKSDLEADFELALSLSTINTGSGDTGDCDAKRSAAAVAAEQRMQRNASQNVGEPSRSGQLAVASRQAHNAVLQHNATAHSTAAPLPASSSTVNVVDAEESCGAVDTNAATGNHTQVAMASSAGA